MVFKAAQEKMTTKTQQGELNVLQEEEFVA